MKNVARSVRLGSLVVAALLGIAACGGGNTSTLLPVTPADNVAAARRQGKAEIVIRIPLRKKTHRRVRQPEFISPSTQSLTLAISGQATQTFNLSANSPGCGSKAGYVTCSLSAFAPVGKQTLTIVLFDQPNALGHELSAASTSVTVAPGRVTTVPIVLEGVVAMASVLLGAPGTSNLSIPPGVAQTISVSVSAYDIDGNLILAPGNYAKPIALSNSDRSGATKLSATSVVAPGAAITLTYDGAALTSATITPSILSGFPQPQGAAKLSLGTPGLTTYLVPTVASDPFGITRGPDGASWFTEFSGNKIGRIALGSAITEFPLPTKSAGPENVTTGPDGALWFTENCAFKIGRMTTAGTFTEYQLPTEPRQSQYSIPFDITTGPDGALWFTEWYGNFLGHGPYEGTVGKIGRITTDGHLQIYPIPATGSVPQFIVAGPDNALWFADEGTNAIGRITTAGAVTEYPVPSLSSNIPSGPTGITVGPDGALWFTEKYSTEIGRITTGGTVTQYPLPANLSGQGQSVGIVAGSDGALWFTVLQLNLVGRITTAGVVTTYPLPTTTNGTSSNSDPTMIMSGSDGALWYTAQNADVIGHIPVSIADGRIAPHH